MDRCDAAFKRTVALACYDALEKVGFTRFRKECVDWPLGEGFHCWVGLNKAIDPDAIKINPFVGVHVVPIDKFWTSLTVGKYPSKYNRGFATYGRHMGELAPDVDAFYFRRLMDIEAEARRLACLYVTVGIEFAKSIADYESLLPLLRQRVSMLGGYPQSYTSCLYLMGRKAEARAFVEGFLPQHQDSFEGFAVPFLRLLDGESDGHPMELHHKDRTMEGDLQPMTRTEHRLGENYKKNHPG